jgi:hypothetical protein
LPPDRAAARCSISGADIELGNQVLRFALAGHGGVPTR